MPTRTTSARFTGPRVKCSGKPFRMIRQRQALIKELAFAFSPDRRPERERRLAQLAHRQGDYAVAIEQYELLLTATDAGPRVLANGDVIRRNLALASEAERLHALRARAPSAHTGD